MRSLTDAQTDVRIGLEIHFQLKGEKLFCRCPTEGKGNKFGSFWRKLRAVSGEGSSVDRAAVMEMEKEREFHYEITDNSCLVEFDEEPPHTPNAENIDAAIKASLLLNCKIVDAINFMRKIVIDGSNTSGFQRTAIVGINGYFEHGNKKIGISTVCLEEEASRKIDEKDNKIYYSLERLGIPLIEVSTSPDISSPKEAREVAKNLGMLIRRIGKIQRDVDSIRQDLNISINGGNRVEIKGVQSLSAIETVLENEIKRQKSLIDISQILKQRGLNQDDIRIEFIDIAHEAIKWNSNIIRKGIEQGNKIFIFKLPKLKGLLKNGNYRFGKELADRLRVIGIGGMIHSDELPAYGINESMISWIRQILNLEENDAFGIIAIPESKSALVKNILEGRVTQSLDGVPAETRAAIGDETRFMRPLPGSSRMYPETDIPLIIITKEMLEKNIKDLPEGVDERIKKLESLGIPKQEAMVSLDLGLDEIIEEIVKKYGNPTVASSFINRVRPKENDKEKLNIIFNLLNQGKIPKEALDTLYQYPEKLEELITSSKQTPQLENRIREIVQARRELILERGENAFKPIMGEVMREMRGKLEGQIISKIVRDEIDKIIHEK